jgi:hypothetical protein
MVTVQANGCRLPAVGVLRNSRSHSEYSHALIRSRLAGSSSPREPSFAGLHIVRVLTHLEGELQAQRGQLDMASTRASSIA